MSQLSCPNCHSEQLTQLVEMVGWRQVSVRKSATSLLVSEQDQREALWDDAQPFAYECRCGWQGAAEELVIPQTFECYACGFYGQLNEHQCPETPQPTFPVSVHSEQLSL